MKINALSREDKRRAERAIARQLKRREDRKSPFARQYREEMMEKCDIEIKGNRWHATLDGETSELLTDYIGHTKNMRPWASRKESSRRLAASYYRLAAQAMADGDYQAMRQWTELADNVGPCAGRLEFEEYEDGSIHLKRATFCHAPLCPVCNWRKAVKAAALLVEAMDRLVSDEDQRVLHLVLTVPNVRLEDLRETFDRMSQAFARMTKQGWWKKRITGYYRKFEWTISSNPKMIAEGRLAHPHMHILVTVPAAYFDSVPDWVSSMATAFRLRNYNPMRSAARCGSYGKAVCNVRAVLAKWILDQASDDGVDIANTEMWRTPYRGRYQRLIRHIDEIAAKHRPALDVDEDDVKAAVKAFAAEIAEVGDPLYVDEPEQLMFLRMWQAAYGDASIEDVKIKTVKVRRGNIVSVAGQNKSVNEEMRAAVAEVVKYVGKESDYILPRDPDETDRRVAILREQLTGLHANSSGGLVKEYIAQVKEDWEIEDEDEDKDLVYLGPKQSNGDGERPTIIAVWSSRLHAYVIERGGYRRKDDDMQDGVSGSMFEGSPPGERERCRQESPPEAVQLEMAI